MIARIWRGSVPKEKKAAYVAYLKQSGLSDYARTSGNRGVQLLCQERGEEVEFLTLTFWDSVDAIKAFAGSDHQLARYYPCDQEFLTRFDTHVEHFDVVDIAD